MKIDRLLHAMDNTPEAPADAPPGWSGDLFRIYRAIGTAAEEQFGTKDRDELGGLPEDTELSPALVEQIGRLEQHCST